MPSGKKARAGKSEPEAVVEAEAPEAVEAEAPAEETVEPTPVEAPTEKPRRRNFLRRRKNEPVTAEQTEAEVAEVTEVTEVAPTPAEVSAEPEVDETPADDKPADETVDADEIGEAEKAEETEPAEEPVLVPHQPAGKRLKVAAATAAALFVAGGAFLGATAQPVIANRAMVETKLNIARTAANAITTLWSYTPENMDSLGERSARYLSGDFAFQYKKFIDSIVATNKQAQVTNTTSVLGTAVESVSANDASAIVYTNSTATSPVSKNIPSLRYLSYRLEMKRDDSDWRITRMTTVTTLDLTPQL